MHDFSIREATSPDYPALGNIMFEAVRNGTPQYTEAQRVAWAPEPRSGIEWHNRLNSLTVFLAESRESPLGFMALANDYVDLAYILPVARGSGMFRGLYNEIEASAHGNGVKRLWTHASLTAQTAFSAVGFCTTTKETVKIGDVPLDRFEMEKHLVTPVAV